MHGNEKIFFAIFRGKIWMVIFPFALWHRYDITWSAVVELVVACKRPSLPQSSRIALLVPRIPRSSQELSLLAE